MDSPKKQQLSGVRYGIETMINDLKEAEEVLDKTDYRMLNILGSASTMKKRVATHSSNF